MSNLMSRHNGTLYRLQCLIPEDEASEPETIRAEDEEEFGTQDESPISFRLSRPNECMSRNDQSDEEWASSGDSAVLFLQGTEEIVHAQRDGEDKNDGI